jgi:hypothetical protein
MATNYADSYVDSSDVQVRTGPRQNDGFSNLPHLAEVKGIVHRSYQRAFIIHAEETSAKDRGVKIVVTLPYDVVADMLAKALKVAAKS